MICSTSNQHIPNANANGTRKSVGILDIMNQAYEKLRVGDGAGSCIEPENIDSIKNALIRIFDRFSTEGAFLPLIYTFDFKIEQSKKSFCIGPTPDFGRSPDFEMHAVPQTIWWAEWRRSEDCNNDAARDCASCGDAQWLETFDCWRWFIELRTIENFSRFEHPHYGQINGHYWPPVYAWYQSGAPNGELVFNDCACVGDHLILKPLLPFSVDLFESSCQTICEEMNDPNDFDWTISDACFRGDRSVIEKAKKNLRREKCKADCFTTTVKICDPCKGDVYVEVVAKRKCRTKPRTYTMARPIELPTGYHAALVDILAEEIAIIFRDKTDPRIIESARRAEARLMRRNDRTQEHYPDNTTPWGFDALYGTRNNYSGINGGW